MNNDATALINAEGTRAYPMDAALAQGAEACPSCKDQIPGGEQFCPRCGFQRGTWAEAAQPQAASSGAKAPVSGSGTGERQGADPARSPFYLEDASGRRYGLMPGETFIGRGEVDIQLPDSFASRKHASFTVEGEDVLVRDLGSSNGTFIEDAQLGSELPLPLSDGERVKIGQTVLTLHRNIAGDGIEDALKIGTPSTDVDEAIPAEDEEEDTLVALRAVTSLSASDETEEPAQSPWRLQLSEGEPFILRMGTTTFGRKAEKVDFVVSDGYVSSLHGQFEASEDELTLTDLGSTNGTSVNEEKLGANVPRALAAGDVITLGQTQIVVALEE